ncbi:methyltransferase-domain-containing protein [Syncephalis fuscata]|nr:methyltransferase-domain-containing protein [Syncephalis fuscata]
MNKQQQRQSLALRQKQQLKAALAKTAARDAARKAGVAITTESARSTKKAVVEAVESKPAVASATDTKKRKHNEKAENTNKNKRSNNPAILQLKKKSHINKDKRDDGDDAQLTPLQQKMKKKLQGARFRWLNEQLYTSPGDTAFKLFSDQPELFDQYHEGFRLQVTEWPENPLERYIADLQSRTEKLTVADMGCGEAMLALRVGDAHKIHSFDLVAGNERITACDIANVPLADNSVDVVIFCLSLMGTNFIDFITEAIRILRSGGQLKVAEVISRFTNVDQFVAILASMGLKLERKDSKNKMFIFFDFVKETSDIANTAIGKSIKHTSKQKRPKEKNGIGSDKAILKPCIYKRR